MELNYQTFNDVDQHARAQSGWQQRYCQIGAGKFCSSLTYLSFGGISLFRETSNQKVRQHGAGPKGTITFGIPLNLVSPINFSGGAVTTESLIVVRDAEEFMMHSPEEMDLVGVTVPLDGIAICPELEKWIKVAQPARRNALLAPSPAVHRAGRQFMTMLEALGSEPRPTSDDELEQWMADQVLGVIDGLFSAGLPSITPGLSRRCQHDIVERSCKLVLAAGEEPVTVATLCERFKVSRRTIQNSFREITGMAPLEYLRAIRLSAVRKLLQTTRARDLDVVDAASRWNFLHRGNFACDYKRQFGELPSQTPRGQ